MSLFAPFSATSLIPDLISWALLAISALLSILIVRATRWMKIALAQWVGLLIGLNSGYFILFGTLIGSHAETIVSACAATLFACSLPCMLSHPPERATFLPTVFPLPEPTVTTEDFCAEAADAFGFTPREEETLCLVLENYETADIARELGVTAKTAKSYLRKICRKVGSADLDGLVDELDAWYAERYEQPESPL